MVTSTLRVLSSRWTDRVRTSSGLGVLDGLGHVLHAFHRLAADGDEDIAALQSGVVRGAVCDHVEDDDARLLGEVHLACQLGVEVGDADAEPRRGVAVRGPAVVRGRPIAAAFGEVEPSEDRGGHDEHQGHDD